jgi:hypothetical protein
MDFCNIIRVVAGWGNGNVEAGHSLLKRRISATLKIDSDKELLIKRGLIADLIGLTLAAVGYLKIDSDKELSLP